MFIYTRFEDIRKEKGIKKTFLAEKLHRTPTIFQDWKAGKSKPNYEQLTIVARELGTTPEYLTGETDEKKPLVNNDEELTDLLERVRDDPDLRMLFSVTKGATKEDIQKAIKIIQMLKGE